MKKLIIASVAMALVIAAAAAEVIYTTKIFRSLEECSRQAVALAETCVKYKQSAEREREEFGVESASVKEKSSEAEQAAESKIAELDAMWKRNKLCVMIFGNHAVVKNIDEKVASLAEQAKVKQWEDASVQASALNSYFFGLADDTHPLLGNLF